MDKIITITDLQNKARYSKDYDNTFQLAQNLIDLKKQETMLKLKMDKIKKMLLDYMESNDLDKIVDDVMGSYISKKGKSERIIIDAKRLQTEFSEVYNNCIKISTVKPHLEIKTK